MVGTGGLRNTERVLTKFFLPQRQVWRRCIWNQHLPLLLLPPVPCLESAPPKPADWRGKFGHCIGSLCHIPCLTCVQHTQTHTLPCILSVLVMLQWDKQSVSNGVIILPSIASLNKTDHINKTASPQSALGSHLCSPAHEGKTRCR